MKRIIKVAIPFIHRMVLRKAAKLLTKGEEYDEYFFYECGGIHARVTLGEQFELVRRVAPATKVTCDIIERKEESSYAG